MTIQAKDGRSATADAIAGLKNLSLSQVRMIDEALGAVGEFGEVRLVVQKGRLRFLITQRSFDALKYRPGEIERRA